MRAPPTRCIANAGNGTIAILPFYGIAVQSTDALHEACGFLSLWHFTQAFHVALADDAIGCIVIDLDSPGGSVYGVMELADEIYRTRASKPIFAFANSLAASGANWIASAASEFYVTPGGEVGGIGVHYMHIDLSKGLEKAGIKTTLIAAGKFKTEGNPYQPLGTNARTAMQKRIDGYYRAFVTTVAKHRNTPESTVRGGMGQGRLLGAELAKHENMVDGIATSDDVVHRLAQSIAYGTPAMKSARLHIPQPPVSGLNDSPTSTASRTVTCAAAREHEIELLTLCDRKAAFTAF